MITMPNVQVTTNFSFISKCTRTLEVPQSHSDLSLHSSLSWRCRRSTLLRTRHIAENSTRRSGPSNSSLFREPEAFPLVRGSCAQLRKLVNRVSVTHAPITICTEWPQVVKGYWTALACWDIVTNFE
jgi:hypothetical protein